MIIQITSPEQKLKGELQKWKMAQDWGIEGSWTHLFPQTHLELHLENFPLQSPLKAS